jgi:hypothetical protein
MVLTAFLLGIVFAIVGTRVLGTIGSFFSFLGEWWESYVSVKIMKNQLKIHKMQMKTEVTETRVIGFQSEPRYPDRAEEEEDDEDY